MPMYFANFWILIPLLSVSTFAVRREIDNEDEDEDKGDMQKPDMWDWDTRSSKRPEWLDRVDPAMMNCAVFGAESHGWFGTKCTCQDGTLQGNCGSLSGSRKFYPIECPSDKQEKCDPKNCQCVGPCSAFGARQKGTFFKECVCHGAHAKLEGICGSLRNRTTFKIGECSTKKGCDASSCRCRIPPDKDPGCDYFFAKELDPDSNETVLGNCHCSGTFGSRRLQGECGALNGHEIFPSTACKKGCRRCKCEKVVDITTRWGGRVGNLLRTKRSGLERLNINSTALKFCYALFHMDTGAEMLGNRRLNSKKVENYCRERLAGMAGVSNDAWNISGSNGSESIEAPRLERLNEVEGGALKHHHKSYMRALSHVCKDECADLVTVLKDKTVKFEIMMDAQAAMPLEKVCAERVVKRVEAETLGCCARACGWNDVTCTLWPFMTVDEQENWQAECCSSLTIMKNSSRELMCNSRLPVSEEVEMTSGDTEQSTPSQADSLADGEDLDQYWTKEGVTSDIGKLMGAKIGQKVNAWRLMLENTTVSQGIADGWWSNPLKFLKPEWQKSDAPQAIRKSSLIEVDSCQTKDEFEGCHEEFKSQYLNSCAMEHKWTAYLSRFKHDFSKKCHATEQLQGLSLPECHKKLDTTRSAMWHDFTCYIFSGSCLEALKNRRAKLPSPDPKKITRWDAMMYYRDLLV